MLHFTSLLITIGFELREGFIPFPSVLTFSIGFDVQGERSSGRCGVEEMLACIACSTKDGGEDGGTRAVATPNGRDAGKSLTSQVNVSQH